ncbi:MAG: MGH1-like glycoside hydrolase domain-containing protein, partial [Acidobacteriota bacterium]
YAGDAWPAEGAVWSVAKRTIRIRRDLRVGVEYLPTGGRPGGRVMTIGEGVYFGDAGLHVRGHLELFMDDVLTYLDGGSPPLPHGVAVPSAGATAVLVPRAPIGEGPPTAPAIQRPPEPAPDWSNVPDILAVTSYWHPPERGPRFFEPASTEPPRPRDDTPVLEAVAAARSGLTLETDTATDAPFDLASPRALMLGRQRGRIQELWTYPLRLLRDLRFGVAPAGEAFEWIDADADEREFVARPEGNTIRWRGDEVAVTLHLAVPRGTPGLLALLTVEADEPVDVVAVWDVDLGTMWPRSAHYFGPLEMGWDDGGGAVVWRDPGGDAAGYGGWGRDADRVLLGYVRARDLVEGRLRRIDPEEEPESPGSTRVAVQISVDPRREAVLPFAVHGGPMDTATARQGFVTLLEDPAAVWTTNANYARQFLGQTLEMASPDPTFNEAFSWAKVGLDAFRVTTPGMGTGLVAGYAASRDRRWSDPASWEWAANNDFLRRPGYAWYFGRDSVWTALAADSYGDTALTSEALRLLARYQDVDGKIFHEMSPSWAIHYDAADSTPLFLLGLEHHLRVSGDRELLRTLWPTVRRAMRFLFSTDTDGDGLIENTDVGHGWIEGGKFYGAHTTFYLAGLWAATLEATERMATWIGDEELASRCRDALETVRATLNRDFWNDRDRFYYYGKLADGSFMPIRTILPAVPMYFGLLDAARARPLLELFAGGEITTDWGVRMAERSNPDYDPEGYHQGMVWPLYTGWAALAAYEYHHPLSAWIHVNENLRLYRFDNLGYLPEALHGERLRATGVTSHQAWSQAMAILPVVEGLLGIHPDAMAGRLRIHPHLPGGWSEVAAQPIRIGSDAFGIRMERDTERTTMQIELSLNTSDAADDPTLV